MSNPDHLRLQVTHVDAPHIHGTDIHGTTHSCSLSVAAYRADITALSEGDTIMLLGITPNADGTLQAQRLIVEPDYLIDISSLSACFTDSGAHPMRYLLSMLSPKDTTKHILLGNTANQFLDDCVNHTPQRPASFDASIRKAFAADALKFAVCPDINASFFQEARNQYAHIQSSIAALHRRYPKGSEEGGRIGIGGELAH